MRRKPIFKYRLNGWKSSKQDVIDCANHILYRDWEQKGFENEPEKTSDIDQSMKIIRAHHETVEYLGV